MKLVMQLTLFSTVGKFLGSFPILGQNFLEVCSVLGIGRACSDYNKFVGYFQKMEPDALDIGFSVMLGAWLSPSQSEIGIQGEACFILMGSPDCALCCWFVGFRSSASMSCLISLTSIQWPSHVFSSSGCVADRASTSRIQAVLCHSCFGSKNIQIAHVLTSRSIVCAMHAQVPIVAVLLR
jgi:hypothetical protein